MGTIRLAPRPNDEGKKEFTGMIEGGPTVYLVRDYLVTRLNKKAQDFVQQPTPTVGAGTPAPAVHVQEEPEPPEGEEPIGEMGDEQE